MVTSVGSSCLKLNLECNLKIRYSQKWPRKRWPVYCGNIEWVNLKQNTQSTTCIDRQVGTLTTCFLLSNLFLAPAVNSLCKTIKLYRLWKGGKIQAPLCSTLFSKRSAYWFRPVLPVTPWVTDPAVGSCQSKMTRGRGRWPRDLRKLGWFSCALLLERSVSLAKGQVYI